jgi:hypothetical protein
MKPMMIPTGTHIVARWIAKKAIEQELRNQGVRITLVPPRVINEKVPAYIAQHPEIWAKAIERARLIEEAEERRKAARRKKRNSRSTISRLA